MLITTIVLSSFALDNSIQLVRIAAALRFVTAPANGAWLLQATNWGLRGSDLVENLNLGRRFSLDFRAVLTWTTAREKAAQAGNGSALASPQDPAGAGPGAD